MKLRVERFTWHRDTNTLSAEASDFGALDARIAIESPSGVVAAFVLDEIVRDADGDVETWLYAPETPYMTQIKQVIIWND